MNRPFSRATFIFLAIFGWSGSAESQPIATEADGIASSSRQSITSLSLLDQYAAELAKQPYQPEPPLAGPLAELDYEQYINILFRYPKGIWADGKHPFWIEFFHRGFVQQDRVDVTIIPNGKPPQEIPYDPAMFDFGKKLQHIMPSKDVGFAGLKIAGRFVPNGDPQELLTFLGSSYFRSRSSDTLYGSSARGIAVDISLNKDEEFPDFRAFWIREPNPNDKSILILALLDGPSLTGAYQFEFQPGISESVLKVKAKLHLRRVPEKIAYAPLTSMWIWGDGLNPPPKDFRQSVHDADGLFFQDNDQWHWRAFARPPYPSVSTFPVSKLQSFAVMQRDRYFPHFRDTGAMYHKRPSIVITPESPWTDGRIELLEIPGAHEGIDNIAAYFVPNTELKIDVPIQLNYQVAFTSKSIQPKMEERPDSPALYQVDNFKVNRTKESITLTLFWDQPDGPRVDNPQPRLDIATVRGEVLRSELTRRINHRYTATIEVRPTEAAPFEIKCQMLGSDNQPLSERFHYLCPHEQPTFVYPAIYTRQE